MRTDVKGTRAVLRHSGTAPNKVRAVLGLIRGLSVAEARDVLQFCERGAADEIGKLLDSAVANAEKNDHQSADELYVAACWADEGPTMKRWRPRARGRATRIRKRTSHITIVVDRMGEAELAKVRGREERRGGSAAGNRARRRRASQQAAAAPAHDHDHDHEHDHDHGEEAPAPAEETTEAADAQEPTTGSDETTEASE
ncbi:MAG: 50S ribosomal protein L22 [Actinomycetes bacterium]